MSDDDLREFGYAPGGYASNCMDCDLPLMFVDKRCRVCRDCAIKRLRLWNVLRGNKEDADTMGKFLTHAIGHIRRGGNKAACETELADGKKIRLTIERLEDKK